MKCGRLAVSSHDFAIQALAEVLERRYSFAARWHLATSPGTGAPREALERFAVVVGFGSRLWVTFSRVFISWNKCLFSSLCAVGARS